MTGTRTRTRYLKGEARTAAIATAKELYEAGASVHSVAEQLGRSYGGAHVLLVEAKVTFRPRGGGRLMARSIGMAADATVFRAVITITASDGSTSTKHEGPYGGIGAARARVSFWTNYLAVRDEDTFEPTGESRASGHVEEGSVTWTKTA